MEPDDRTAQRVRIPSDTDRPDTIIFGLTLRQAGILAGTGVGLWVLWAATKTFLPGPVFLAFAVPAFAVALAITIGRRDGLGLDAWLLAALRHRRTPKAYVAADAPVQPVPRWVASSGQQLPLPAPLQLPARGIDARGVIDLGGGDAVSLVAASTVNFTLRTTSEQDSLLTGFGRWLNSLEQPVQILVRARRVDLSGLSRRIVADASALPHPALEKAARSHAEFLTEIAGTHELLHRQVLLALHGAEARLTSRAAETAQALNACGVTAVVLDGLAAASSLADCLDPGAQPAALPTSDPGAVVARSEGAEQ